MSELKIIEGGLMRVKEIAEYLNVPESTIYNLTFREAIPHYHIGKVLRFKKSDVDKWLESNSQGVSNSESLSKRK